MRYLPIFADLEQADVLVVGGGEQAAQKVRLLRKTGARITILAHTLTPELDALGADGVWIVRRALPDQGTGPQRSVGDTGKPPQDHPRNARRLTPSQAITRRA